MNLFVIYIGGAHQQSLIELHDMRFVIANQIKDTYDHLRQSWWGTAKSLHLDAWGILDYADGHNIKISTLPPKPTHNKLYFVNLGGYDHQQFTELHKNVFVVASNAHQAKQKAVQQIKEWQSPHRDYLFEVDGLIDMVELISGEQYYLHLEESSIFKPFKFTCCYTPLGK